MSGRPIKKGTLNVSSVVRILDSTDGTPETGVTSATGGLAFNYRREGAAAVAITALNDLALLTTAHTDGGILHIGDGYYRIDFQDAAFASGADGVLLTGTATGMVVIGTYHPLVDYDPYDTVRLGLTALPNAAADGPFGLPISDAGGLDLDTVGSNVAAILVDTGEIGAAGAGLTEAGGTGDHLTAINLPNQTMDITGNITGNLSGSVGSVTGAVGSVTAGVTVTTNNDKTGYALSAASIQAIWDALTSALVTVGSIGKLLVDNINATISSRMATTHIDATAGKVDGVALVDTTTTNTDMRGTDSALLASTFSTMFAGITALAEWLGLIAGKQAGDATALTEIKATGAGSGTYDPTTDSLEAIRDTAPLGTAMRGTDNAALASVATEARLAELDAANLPTDVAAIQSDTDDIQTRLPAALVGGRIDATVDGTGMEAAAIDAILQRQITESYNTDGTAPTVEQALMGIFQCLTEFAISGTTITVKKLDGATTALTFTLDDATNPTSRTRAS